MALLFSTDPEEASEELKKYLGFLDADFNFKNIRQDIITATNEVIGIIGKEVYAYAEEKFETISSYDDADIEMQVIDAIRYPIAVNAYRLYAPSNDISQTNDGRKMRNDDHEKGAFEWQIERDNKAQEKRYYRALDDLIKFLDNSKTTSETAATIWTIWTQSDNYKKSQKLFIRTTEDFSEFFPIESRYLLMMLSPGLAYCESREIKSRITAAKFTELKEKLQTSTEITDEKDLQLLHLIKEATAAYALAWAIPRMSIQILPEGVVQSFSSERMSLRASKPALMSEPEAARQAFTQTFLRAARDIEDLMRPVPVAPAELKTIPDQLYGDQYFST